ncbi:MAG TPA: DUF3141 domain-containing protein [Casimicrobiaceae bacterium]
MADLNKTIDRSMAISRNVAGLYAGRVKEAYAGYGASLRRAQSDYTAAGLPAANPQQWWSDWAAYWIDAGQRHALFWDTIRERGNQWIAHEEAGKPPLLHYRYEMLADARTFEHPCNHALVRIVPPAGAKVDDRKRPFIIIDPRAGHGPGIGGFKDDSQVGVALREGHAVYFVIFFPEPVPGQTLADVTDAEAEFVRIVAERHPASPKPSLIGNCQGGWAVMMLAAARPDMTGPLVINGAPMSYWAGNDGDNPMRYAGGLTGGAWISLLASDLGAGTFDGAHLVANFENLNPANTLWDKHYHLYDEVDGERERYLEFERWWGGYYLFNEEEIRWIVNNLFVGNKLAAGEARLGPGRYFDLKSIKQPIVVFASMGDNITPPQQAFNWIADLYASTEEIKANGQTIVGLIHEDVGHLGIFVSGKVAKKEHTQIFEVLKSIEALPPGLYGMEIHEEIGRSGEVEYDVTIHERSLEDLKKLQKYDRVDEKPFEAVAALSELTERAYELLVRPAIRDAVPEWLARAMREWHPLRAKRWMLSDRNPFLAGVPAAAAMARAWRRPRKPDNAGRRAEKLGSNAISASLDLYRGLRDAAYEASFFQVYGNMMSLQMADQRAAIRRQTRFDPRALPAVRQVLDDLDRGGLPEAVVRSGLLVAKAGGGKRRLAQIESVRAMLEPSGVLEGLTETDLRRVLHDETIVVEFEPAQAKRTLPRLVASQADRRKLNRLFDALAEDPHLNDKQRGLVAELQKLVPVRAAAKSVKMRRSKPR